jgi:hypothetical protein
MLSSTLSLLLSACHFGETVGEFSVNLGKKLRTENMTLIDLATVTTLPWDELFIFGPYSDRERNCQLLQLGWLRCRTTLPSDMSKGQLMLVFREKGKLLRSERHLRINGDFYSQTVQLPQPIKRSSAKFSVTPLSNVLPQGTQWFQLEYIGESRTR